MKISTVIEDTLIAHDGYQKARNGLEQCMKYAIQSPEPVCLAIIGESRTGKSRSIYEFRMDHGPTRSASGVSMPVAYIHAPSKPTAKSLAETILECLGDPKPSAGTEGNMTTRIRKLMRASGTRMLIIDEFQHFQDKGTRKIMHHVTDWLKILVERTGIALVVAGLPSAMIVINTNEQLRGRFLAPIEMGRFDWRDDDSQASFIAVLDAFCEQLKEQMEVPEFGTEEMAFRFYCATGGLMGYVTRLLRQVIWDVLDRGDSIISLKDLERANEEVIWSTSEAQGITNPFDPKFISIPNDTLLASIRKIGTRDFDKEELIATQRRRQTMAQKSAEKISSALAA